MTNTEGEPSSPTQPTIDVDTCDGSFICIAKDSGKALDKGRFTPDELMAHIANKLKIVDTAIEKDRTPFGWVSNLFNREELDSVILDGVVLRQLYEMAGETPPAKINRRSSYQLHHSTVRRLRDDAIESSS